MSQLSFEDLVNGTVPDASDFNSRFNALKNRINNGMESDNIADNSITTAKINNDAVTLGKLAHGTLGGIPYYAASGTPTELAGNTTTTQKFLAQTGDGTNSATPAWTEIPDAVFESSLLHVRDEKTAGTAGGTLTSGSRQTRVLNTVKTNEISGASLSSNQITLPAGTYFAIGRSPGYTCGLHKIFLRNTTDGADLLNGANAYATPSGNQTDSVVQGRFTISAEKVLEIQHMVETTRSTDGAGDDCNLGAAEVYSEIMIWKVA